MKVNIKANNPLVNINETTACIVFDFKEPILTKTVSNEVYDPTDVPNSSREIREIASGVNVEIYPNPFSNKTTLVIKGPRMVLQGLSVEFYDILGRNLRKQKIPLRPDQNNEITFEIEKGNLPKGILIYRLKGYQGLIHSGKIVIQ